MVLASRTKTPTATFAQEIAAISFKALNLQARELAADMTTTKARLFIVPKIQNAHQFR